MILKNYIDWLFIGLFAVGVFGHAVDDFLIHKLEHKQVQTAIGILKFTKVLWGLFQVAVGLVLFARLMGVGG